MELNLQKELVESIPDVRGDVKTFSLKKWDPSVEISYELKSLRESIQYSRPYLADILSIIESSESFILVDSSFKSQRKSTDTVKVSKSPQIKQVSKKHFSTFCLLFPTLAYLQGLRNQNFLWSILEVGDEHLLKVSFDLFDREETAEETKDNAAEETKDDAAKESDEDTQKRTYHPFAIEKLIPDLANDDKLLQNIESYRMRILSIISEPVGYFSPCEKGYFTRKCVGILLSCFPANLPTYVSSFISLRLSKDFLQWIETEHRKTFFSTVTLSVDIESLEEKILYSYDSEEIQTIDTYESKFRISSSLAQRALLNFDFEMFKLICSYEHWVPDPHLYLVLKWYVDRFNDPRGEQALNLLQGKFPQVDMNLSYRPKDRLYSGSFAVRDYTKTDENADLPYSWSLTQDHGLSDLLNLIKVHTNEDLLRFIISHLCSEIGSRTKLMSAKPFLFSQCMSIDSRKIKNKANSSSFAEAPLLFSSFSEELELLNSLICTARHPTFTAVLEPRCEKTNMHYHYSQQKLDQNILTCISDQGRISLLHWLIEVSVDLYLLLLDQLKNQKYEQTALSYITRSKVIKYILTTTPLHLAAAYGHSELCYFLMTDMKVPVDIRDRFGRTPLMYTFMLTHDQVPLVRNYESKLEELYRNQNEPYWDCSIRQWDAAPLFGIDWPRMMKCVPASIPATTQLLLSHGASLNAKDNHEFTCMTYLTAFWSRYLLLGNSIRSSKKYHQLHQELLEIILESDCFNVNQLTPIVHPRKKRSGAINHNHMTLYMAALGSFDLKSIEKLFQRGANPFICGGGIFSSWLYTNMGKTPRVKLIKSKIRRHLDNWKETHPNENLCEPVEPKRSWSDIFSDIHKVLNSTEFS